MTQQKKCVNEIWAQMTEYKTQDWQNRKVHFIACQLTTIRVFILQFVSHFIFSQFSFLQLQRCDCAEGLGAGDGADILHEEGRRRFDGWDVEDDENDKADRTGCYSNASNSLGIVRFNWFRLRLSWLSCNRIQPREIVLPMSLLFTFTHFFIIFFFLVRLLQSEHRCITWVR